VIQETRRQAGYVQKSLVAAARDGFCWRKRIGCLLVAVCNSQSERRPPKGTDRAVTAISISGFIPQFDENLIVYDFLSFFNIFLGQVACLRPQCMRNEVESLIKEPKASRTR
jgi:hypothetical protein